MARLNKWDTKHLRNGEHYARQIEAIYQAAVREAAAIGASIPDFSPDKPFSFADYPSTKARIDKLTKTLKSSVTTVILDGIDTEWTLANDKNSELCDTVFGKYAGKLTKEQQRRYYSTNDAARKAFTQRKTAGLNLSDRVWRYTDQFKAEIEMGLDLGLRDGVSADEMSRQLRQYLRQPDKLFRRVRDEHGQLHLSKQAAAYHPGAGVYRSSYKNARRLAATETNLAYRTSDYTRWQQLDFVVGIEIKLSNNHTLGGMPFTDICDQLAGRYPKDFKFTGWHPHCRCHAVSILKTQEEMAADNERIISGEPLTGESVNKVSDVPDNFKSWIADNKDRIARAKSQPYFLRDNERYANPKEQFPTIAERAAARHAARTPMQIEAIRKQWSERKAVRHYGQNVLRYMDGISDVDTLALSKALNGGDTGRILSEARRLKATGKEILSLSRLDNPMQVAREFSMVDAISVNSAVEKKLTGWAHLPLEGRKKKLLFEIEWVEKNKKYATWPAAQSAYRKELTAVVDAIDWAKINEEFAAASSFKTKSNPYKSLVAKLQEAISTQDKAAAHETLSAIKSKRAYLEKETAKREAQKMLGGGVHKTFAEDAYTQARKDNAVWCKNTSASMSKLKGKADEVYMAASEAETDAAYSYTSGSGYINRPLRGYDRYWDESSFKGIGKVPLDNESPRGPRDIENLTKLIDKSSYDKDIWLQRGIESDGLAGFLQLTNLDEKAVQALVGQTITDPAFMSCGAAKGTGFSGNIINIYCPKGTKMLYIDGRSAYAHENEMLLQRNTRFRVTKVEKAGYRYYIDVEVVGQI